MKIGQLAKLAGVPASTIRYYEAEGLLPKVKRTDAGYRIYDERILERVQLIKLSQQIGFSLEELPKLLNETTGLEHDMVIAKLRIKSQDMGNLIAQLQVKKSQIAELITQLDSLWRQGECMSTEQLQQIIKVADM